MKLRSFDNFLIKEAAESNAHKKAVEMGLQYKGFGMWVDPRTNKITHKTEKGELIPADGPSAELAGDGGGNLRPDVMDAKPGINDQGKGPQQAPGSGVLKAPEPGTEQYPRAGNWNPGPNGDNCVTDQPPPKDLSFDMFVGKTNYVKWVAGSDGSNYKNIDYRKITDDQNNSVDEIKNHSFNTFLGEDGEPAQTAAMGQPSPGNQGGMSNSEKLKSQGFEHLGFNNYRRDDGTSAKIIGGEIIYYNANGEVSAEDSGGLSVMGAKPTWSRPSDGQSMTPPAQPETPDEIASVPDPIPGQAPMGYDKFMNDKALESRKQEELKTQIDIAQKEVDDKYAVNPILNAVKLRSDKFINDAYESGDEEEMAVAGHLMDVLVDKADQFKDLMLGIPPDIQPGLAQQLTRVAEREARLRNLEADEVTDFETLEDAQDDLEDTLKKDNEREDLVNSQQTELEEIQKTFDLNMENELTDLEGRKKSNREKIYEKFREGLKNIPNKATKDSYIQAVNLANTFIGRPNSGKGKNNLGFADVETLNANKGRLIAGYANGNYEKVEEFVRTCRPLEVSDDMVDLSYEVLPAKFKSALKGKGNVSGTYKGHFLGYNEDGSVKRGGTGSDDRAKWMWKICLEQGFKDAYTGLPLDLNSMDLEHVVGFNNKDDGKPTKEDKESREHEKNMVMINTNINQKKMDMNMAQFLESQVDPISEWTEDQYGNRDEKYQEMNRIIDSKEQLAAMLIKDGDLEKNMTGDVLMQYFDNEEQENKTFNDKLKKGRKNNKELAEVEMMKSVLGKKIFQAAGFSTGLTKPSSGRGTTSIKEEGYYRGMLVSYASLDKKGRDNFRTVYNNAFAIANTQAVQSLESGEPITQSQQRDIIVDALNRSGLIDDRVRENKNMQKIWGKGDQSYDSMFKSQKINKEKEQQMKEEVTYTSRSFSSFMESRRQLR